MLGTRVALAIAVALVSARAQAQWERTVGPRGAPQSEGWLSDGRLDGPWVSWYPNGYLAEVGAYRDGREHGAWLTYDDEGRLSAMGSWAFGRPEGEWSFFHPSGAVASSGLYVEGYRDGLWVERFADGSVFRTTHWVAGESESTDKSAAWCRDFELEWRVDLGARVEGCVDDDGARVGLWRGFHPNGQVAWERTYAAGLLDEEGFDYHPNGALLHQGHYRIGAPDGIHVWTAADGSIFGVSDIVVGSGDWRTFHDDGRIAEDGAWLGYRQDGVWRGFDADGARLSEVVWSRGKRVRARLWRDGLCVEGGYLDGRRSGLWTAWGSDGMRAWSGSYEDGARVGRWSIGRHEVTFEDDEPVAWSRTWPDGALRELRTSDSWVALWADGSVLEDATLIDGGLDPAPDGADPDTWEHALELQAWLVADPSPTTSELEQTASPSDERAEPRDLGVGFNEPQERYVSEAEGARDDDGIPIGDWIFFHDNGAKKEQGHFEHGARVGRWRGWDRMGQALWEADYVDDRLDGAWKSLRADGTVLLAGHYLRGERAGTWTWLHPNGAIKTVGDYAADVAVGAWRGFHPNGRAAWTGAYARGVRAGRWSFWTSDGREAMTVDYVDGRAQRSGHSEH